MIISSMEEGRAVGQADYQPPCVTDRSLYLVMFSAERALLCVTIGTCPVGRQGPNPYISGTSRLEITPGTYLSNFLFRNDAGKTCSPS